MAMRYHAAMIAPLLIAALAAGAPAQPGCAAHWTVELDRPSFAHNGAGRTFTPAQLAAFRARLQAQVRTAAADACAGKRVARSRAAAVRRVRVLSASAATEPHFYAGGTGTLNLEWAFAEERLAVPARANLVGGLICWADPAEPLCRDAGD